MLQWSSQLCNNLIYSFFNIIKIYFLGIVYDALVFIVFYILMWTFPVSSMLLALYVFHNLKLKSDRQMLLKCIHQVILFLNHL